MKEGSIHELKKELQLLEPDKVTELCIRLAKYKKENKELLSYLLFEAHDLAAYTTNIKNEISALFEDVNKTNNYLAKKTLRKILRTTGKYIKYTGSKETEIELLLFFCKKFKQADLHFKTGSVLYTIYTRQIEKITNTIKLLHEDLQHDYLLELNSITEL